MKKLSLEQQYKIALENIVAAMAKATQVNGTMCMTMGVATSIDAARTLLAKENRKALKLAGNNTDVSVSRSSIHVVN